MRFTKLKRSGLVYTANGELITGAIEQEGQIVLVSDVTRFALVGRIRLSFLLKRKSQSMAAIKKKLIDRVIKRFLWVSQDAEIVRCYPSLGEREAGAFLCLMSDDIRSVPLNITQ